MWSEVKKILFFVSQTAQLRLNTHGLMCDKMLLKNVFKTIYILFWNIKIFLCFTNYSFENSITAEAPVRNKQHYAQIGQISLNKMSFNTAQSIPMR